MEILFVITIFRQDFSVMFLAMVTALLLIKALHWLAQKRVEYIETTPSVPMLSHIRIVSFMGFLLILDSLFLYSYLKHLIQTWQASVSIFFSFEYMILATTIVSTFVKYIFYISDMLMEGQWERKAVYTFYLELIRDLLHLSMYLCFFFLIFVNYGVPLHLIRELYETFRNFKVRVADYIRYRKITSNMNDRFPDATPEELNASDATCIICREEMITAKKLICGHLFHVHCLRSWLERQQTCPTCRALVVPPENVTTTAGGQQGIHTEVHQQETGAAGTSSQGSADGVVDDNLRQHYARLQAATAAASIYEKSYVYPSSNAFAWYPGYSLLPLTCMPSANSCTMDSTGDRTASGELQQQQFATPGGQLNFTYPQVPHYPFIPFQAISTNFTGQRLGTDVNVEGCHLEARERFIQHQIEILQSQLQLLRQQKPGETMKMSSTASDSKGKTSASPSSSSSISDCGCHGEVEEVEKQ